MARFGIAVRLALWSCSNDQSSMSYGLALP
jgi:hypothetical protein